MKTDKYEVESTNLSKAIDIAINIIKKFPPKGWDEKTINHVLNCYVKWKDDAINPKPQFANLTSFKYVKERILTMFQEGHGIFVEEFWKEIKAQNLPYKRENKILKILKRKKINNIHEYDFVTDVIVPYEQEGLIDKDEVILLNQLLGQFEAKKKK